MIKSKKLIIILFISLLAFSLFFVSSITLNENKKTYDPEQKRVIITDKSNKLLAEVKLIYNTESCINNCYADILLNLSEPTKDPFDKLKFYDAEIMKLKSKDYEILVRTTNYTTLKPSVQKNCYVFYFESNGSLNENCTSNIIYIEKNNWNFENYSDKIEYSGEVYLRIKGKIDLDEVVEWIPDFFGVSINEWALWNSSFEEGLDYYWTFDDILNDSISEYNLILLSGSTSYQNGKKNNGTFFSNNWYNTSRNVNTFYGTEKNWTITFWANLSNLEVGSFFGYSNGDINELSLWSQGSFLRFYLSNSFYDTPINQMQAKNATYHIAIRKMGSNISTWINGTNYASMIKGGPDKLGSLIIGNSEQQSGPDGINGIIDELSIYNRSLSDSEIQSLYDNSIGTFHASPPSVEINSPSSKNYDTTSITFNLTATDTDGISSCWYTLNNGIFNYSLTFGDDYTYINTSMDQGNFTSMFYCNDTRNAVNNSENVTFFIDSIFPSISYESETRANNSFTKDSVYVNVSVIETNQDTIKFELHNSTGIYSSFSFTNLSREVNWSGLIEDTYLYNVTINDTLNNINFTETRTITIDNTFPNLTINLPGSTVSSTNPEINITVNDDNIGNCTYNITTIGGAITVTTRTISNCSNERIPQGSLTDGLTYIIYVFVNDSANNINSSNLTFSVSLAQPIVTGVGGGGSGGGEKVQVVVLIKPLNSISSLTDLQRAIIYKEINDVKKLVFGTFAISLTDQDLNDLKERLQNKGIIMDLEELTLWVEQFEQGKIDKVFIDKVLYEKFSLVLATGTYCGDGFCQFEGNDLGIKETFFNCNTDCPGGDVDTATINCLDGNPETRCILEGINYQYSIFFITIIIFILTFPTVKDPTTGKQIRLYKYYPIKLKQARKRFK